MRKVIAVLAYHKIGKPDGDWYTWNYVSENNFKEHLQCLSDNNWKVLSAEQFLRALEEPNDLPQKSALITFDDGYRSNLTTALPSLQTFNYPAVIFVPTAFVGSYNAFDADIFYEPREKICTWDELRELEANGISLQSHGVNHVHFAKLNTRQIIEEVLGSKTTLDKQLQKKVSLFSYPYGDMGNDTKTTEGILLNAGYKAAFLYGGKFFETFENIFQIQRIALGADSDLNHLLSYPADGFN